MNADGSISADMRRKFKQVNHLVELFRPVLAELGARQPEIMIVDASCGNSYLGFLLYHYVRAEMGKTVHIHGVDASPERIETSRRRATDLGFDRMSFEVGIVRTASLPERIDLLVSLHGCDTASDEALHRGVQERVPHLHIVPCCQRELRGLLSRNGRFAPFLADGIVGHEFSALLTDVLRSLWLRTRGYRTETVELVPLEHTLKNRLIRAKFTRRRDHVAREQLESLLCELTEPPFLIRASGGSSSSGGLSSWPCEGDSC